LSEDVHIFRIHNKERNFTIIDNGLIDDDRLSFRATGVLIWLLSRPPTWVVRSNVMAKAKTEGRDAVRTSLTELEDAGYVVRRRVQNPENGQWQQETHVYEDPRDADSQASGIQASEDQSSETQASETQASLEEEVGSTEVGSTEEVSTEQESAPPKGSYTPEFEVAWEIYPRKIGKKPAFKAWSARLKDGETVENLTLAAENYVRVCKRNRTEEQFILHASTFWGANERYVDFLEYRPDPRNARDNVSTDRDAPSGLIDLNAFRRSRDVE
jgi:hypothetical protein